MYCPLTTIGAGVTGAQTVLPERFVVDCKVNPALFVDHVNTKKFDVTPPNPAGLIVIPCSDEFPSRDYIEASKTPHVIADRVTGNLASFAPHAKIIHLDIDPSSISKTVDVDCVVGGDARVTFDDDGRCTSVTMPRVMLPRPPSARPTPPSGATGAGFQGREIVP